MAIALLVFTAHNSKSYAGATPPQVAEGQLEKLTTPEQPAYGNYSDIDAGIVQDDQTPTGT